MKFLFAHDTRFARRDGDVYSADAFPTEVWGRYLGHVDDLIVLAREFEDETKAAKASVLSSTKNVCFNLCPSISSPVKRIALAAQAKALTRQAVEQVDGVIARLPSEYGLLAIAEARRAGKPWLVEMVTCPWDALWNYGNWQGKAYAPIMAARTRRAVASAPYVIYVTREFLQRRYPSRTREQIACSNVMIDTPAEAVLERRRQRSSEPVVLGLIGTLKTRYKGIQTVFAALARCRDQLPPVEFRVLGDGDARPWIEEAKTHGVGDIVHFDGVRNPGDEVMAWLDKVDIYLQPSLQEGLPRATIEAMSRACPVIGSTCAGIPELLEREWCIKPGDDRQLAQLITRMVKSPEQRLRTGERNWREAHEYARDILDARRNELLAAFARETMQAARRGTA